MDVSIEINILCEYIISHNDNCYSEISASTPIGLSKLVRGWGTWDKIKEFQKVRRIEKILAIISFNILSVKWYGKPYYFGNAGYAFPYLLEATNIT